MRTGLVCGAGGFIGHHLVSALKREGLWVRGVDLKRPEFSGRPAGRWAWGVSSFRPPRVLFNQEDPDNPACAEATVYPAAPDSEYGWAKRFAKRLYLAHARNHGLNCRIARSNNIFGPEGTWQGGREKAPAALCCKVAMAPGRASASAASSLRSACAGYFQEQLAKTHSGMVIVCYRN